MNKRIGDMSRDELIDYIIELDEQNGRYERKLEKQSELADHYKHLYSEVKKQKDELQKEMDYVDDYNKHLLKQKDDAVKYINTAIEEGNYFEDDIDTDIQPASYDKYVNSVEILRMLGEIDNE